MTVARQVCGLPQGQGQAAAFEEDAPTTERPAGPTTTTPTGVATFAQDFPSVRRFADRDHDNIVSWNRYPSGSHFATRT
jgi:hypothetical protein